MTTTTDFSQRHSPAFMYQSDITVIPQMPEWASAMDAYVMRRLLLASQERERAIRGLARPFLAAGYLPEELTVVERKSDLLEIGCLVCVKVLKPRSRFRLWLRRVLWACGFNTGVIAHGADE